MNLEFFVVFNRRNRPGMCPTSLLCALKNAHWLILTLCIAVLSSNVFAYEDYDWNNVPIGGGGYITGMKIHPLNGEKRFYRTDVGGAYRWDPQSQSMKQMVFSTNRNHYSVAGIALHPTNQNIVYLGVGRDCNPSNTGILKSTDGGVTFKPVSISGGIQFHFAANGGRTCDVNDPNSARYDPNAPNGGDKDRQGTPLAINPLNTNELFIGTREKGLWILDLTTLEASQIDIAQLPTNDNEYSIRSVVFHPTLNYVYIAYPGHGVYVGNTLTKNFWNLDFPGGAEYPQLLQATDISISKNGDYLLVACEKAGIMKASGIDTVSQAIRWTELAGGLAQTAGNFGYYTVDTSPHDNEVAVTVTAGWNHINQFQATTDGGETWRMVSGSVDLDRHLFQWRTDAFASHVAQLAFDPDDPNRLHYTSWFSTFSSDNWSPASGGIWHSLRAQGHEEIVPTDLVAFPLNSAGNMLMTGSGDHSGFVFDSSIVDPRSFPDNHIDQLTSGADMRSLGADKIKKSASFPFSERLPDNLAVILTNDWDGNTGALLTSSDGGGTWVRKNGYLTSYRKSIVEIASNDPDSMVILNGTGVRFSKDGGDSFSASVGSNAYPNNCGLPFDGAPLAPSTVNVVPKFNNNVFAAGRYLAADKALNCVFYFYSPDGVFNISSDGGATWGVINNQLPVTTDLWNKTRLVSIPGNAGHLFINIQNKLYKTVNGGRTWSQVSSVNKAQALSFGAGFGSYPAIYIFGRLSADTPDHFYRSDDAGQTWIRINEHSEQELWGDNKVIAGDRNTPGRLYATASGQGVVFGDPTRTTSVNENTSVSEVIDGVDGSDADSSDGNTVVDVSGTDSSEGNAVVDNSGSDSLDGNAEVDGSGTDSANGNAAVDSPGPDRPNGNAEANSFGIQSPNSNQDIGGSVIVPDLANTDGSDSETTDENDHSKVSAAKKSNVGSVRTGGGGLSLSFLLILFPLFWKYYLRQTRVYRGGYSKL